MNDSISDNKLCILSFLDLKKLFDSVDGNKLLTKLENIGVQRTTLDWFRNYLFDRVLGIVINRITGELGLTSLGSFKEVLLVQFFS